MAGESRAVQLRKVYAGLALGAVVAGVEEVNGNRSSLELAFRRAWRAWPYAHEFPAIQAGPSRDDIFLRLLDTDTYDTAPAVWQGSWPFVPLIRWDWWDLDDVADTIAEGIPTSAWAALVAGWVGTSCSHRGPDGDAHEHVDVDPQVPTGQCAICAGMAIDDRLPEERGPENP
jgi:hypothetical protein